MIDNIILLITGTLHSRDTHELLDKCHPLGIFEGMAALCVATNVAELYNMVLVDTPIGKGLILVAGLSSHTLPLPHLSLYIYIYTYILSAHLYAKEAYTHARCTS